MVQEAKTLAITKSNPPATMTIKSEEIKAETSKEPSFDIVSAHLDLQKMILKKLDKKAEKFQEGQDKLLKGQNQLSKDLQEKLDSHHKERIRIIDNQAKESQKCSAGIRQEIRQSQEKLSLEIQGNIQTQFKELREEVREVKEIVQNQVTEMTKISN
jgi:predicted transcriptional regulator